MAQDHHYIPAFYLRRWTDDGDLEDQFLRILDQGASDALRHLETTLCKPEDERLRSYAGKSVTA
jgi:hypothetical protein